MASEKVAVALLLKPSGAVAYRLDLPLPLPDVIHHGGVEWRRSHATVHGAAYQRPSLARARTTANTARVERRQQVSASVAAWRAMFGDSEEAAG